MTELRDILDYDLLLKHLAAGVVRSQIHPLYPSELSVFNYTEVAQYDRIWDNVTRQCRGLITAGRPGKEIVLARGFNKFFNLNTDFAPETLEANLPNEIPLVTEKLDGSMGIIYYWDDKVWVATRGSFMSEQAQWATRWLRDRMAEDVEVDNNNILHYLTVGDDHTLIAEIIYSSNRIVVDYDYEGLILTGCVDIETAEEVDREVLEEIGEACGLLVVKRFTKSLAECAGENTPNAEGYVLTYPSTGLKVKVKFEEYVRLHRILTGLNPRAIWEMLVPPSMLVQQPKEKVNPEDGTIAEARRATVDSILNDPKMPATFIEWFGGWVNQLRSQYAGIEARAKDAFSYRRFKGPWATEPTPEALRMVRKAHAEDFMKTPELKSILFAMLDGHEYETIIWKMLKPRGDAPFKKDGE